MTAGLLRFIKPQGKNSIHNKYKGLKDSKKALDTPRDTFASKSTGSVQKNAPPEPPPDLAEVSASWPCLPAEIRAAILTLARSARGGISVVTPSGQVYPETGENLLPKSGEQGVRSVSTPLGDGLKRREGSE